MKASPSRILAAGLALVLGAAPVLAGNTDQGRAADGTAALPSLAEGALRVASLNREFYGREAQDWNVDATMDFRRGKLHAPTPTSHPRATMITTRRLLGLLTGPEAPLLIDVLSSTAHQTIAGAVWLKGAGFSTTSNDRLAVKLDELAPGDRARPMAFFCQGPECWASYNAALRASLIGYEKVYWYRGGLEAWKDARLPTQWSIESAW